MADQTPDGPRRHHATRRLLGHSIGSTPSLALPPRASDELWLLAPGAAAAMEADAVLRDAAQLSKLPPHLRKRLASGGILSL